MNSPFVSNFFPELENLKTQIEHTYFISDQDSSSNEDLSFEKYLNELAVKKRKLFNEKNQLIQINRSLKKIFLALWRKLKNMRDHQN